MSENIFPFAIEAKQVITFELDCFCYFDSPGNKCLNMKFHKIRNILHATIISVVSFLQTVLQ